MRFGVLGPLEVEADQGPVVVGGQKERLLLALLLTRPNRVVPVETLIQGLWGEHPPPTAAKTLQSHVMRLRRALEPGRGRGVAGQVLVTREPGYLLQVPPGMLDVARFEELREAEGSRGPMAGEHGVAAGGNVDIHAEGGSVAGGVIHGDVSLRNPPPPGPRTG